MPQMALNKHQHLISWCYSILSPLQCHSLFVFDINSTSLSHLHLISFHFLTPHLLAVPPSEPLQALPLCLKQEMSPEVTSTSPSPNMTACNMAFVELQALQRPVSVSSSCGGSNTYHNTFNSFSHHAPVYGQFSSQSLITGKGGVHLIRLTKPTHAACL